MKEIIAETGICDVYPEQKIIVHGAKRRSLGLDDGGPSVWFK